MPEILTKVDPDDSVEKLTGRELDAAVAERVMSWQRQEGYNYWMTFTGGGTFKLHALIATWKPSEDIKAAMEVVEKMRELGYRWNAQTPHGKGWEIQCYSTKFRGRGVKFKGLLPEAICRAALAALKALGAE